MKSVRSSTLCTVTAACELIQPVYILVVTSFHCVKPLRKSFQNWKGLKGFYGRIINVMNIF